MNSSSILRPTGGSIFSNFDHTTSDGSCYKIGVHNFFDLISRHVRFHQKNLCGWEGRPLLKTWEIGELLLNFHLNVMASQALCDDSGHFLYWHIGLQIQKELERYRICNVMLCNCTFSIRPGHGP